MVLLCDVVGDHSDKTGLNTYCRRAWPIIV